MNREKIDQAKSRLMLENPYFGMLVSTLEMRENPSIASVRPRGDLMEYNDEYLEVLSVEEVMSILANSALHQALFHTDRGVGKMASVWQLASDYAINDLLVQNGFLIPPLANYSRRFERLYAEEIYTTLLGELDLQEDETSRPKESADLTEEESPPISLLEKKDYERLLQQLSNKRAKQGDLPKGIERLIPQVLVAQVAWRDELYRYVNTHAKSDYRMFPSSKKHLYRGMALPSIYGEELNIAVAIDTSASVDDGLLSLFLSELYEIMQVFTHYTITLIEADAKIQNIQRLTPLEPLIPTFRGGGGTDFRPVFVYLEHHHYEMMKFLIYFTDGEGEFPEMLPSMDTLWVMPESKEVPFGDVLIINC